MNEDQWQQIKDIIANIIEAQEEITKLEAYIQTLNERLGTARTNQWQAQQLLIDHENDLHLALYSNPYLRIINTDDTDDTDDL